MRTTPTAGSRPSHSDPDYPCPFIMASSQSWSCLSNRTLTVPSPELMLSLKEEADHHHSLKSFHLLHAYFLSDALVSSLIPNMCSCVKWLVHIAPIVGVAGELEKLTRA